VSLLQVKTVHKRIHFVLPLMQVVVAVGLMTHNYLAVDSLANPRWRHSDWQFCGALNAPATMLAEYPTDIAYRWLGPYYPLNEIIEWIVRLCLIWLLWYCVAIEMGGRGQSVLASRTRMRKVADFGGMLFGVVLANDSVVLGRQFGLLSIPYLLWAVLLVTFYGHDLWTTFGSARRPAAT